MATWDVDLQELDRRIRAREAAEAKVNAKDLPPCKAIMGYDKDRPINWNEKEGRVRWL